MGAVVVVVVAPTGGSNLFGHHIKWKLKGEYCIRRVSECALLKTMFWSNVKAQKVIRILRSIYRKLIKN
jgi:hypothetical protein